MATATLVPTSVYAVAGDFTGDQGTYVADLTDGDPGTTVSSVAGSSGGRLEFHFTDLPSAFQSLNSLSITASIAGYGIGGEDDTQILRAEILSADKTTKFTDLDVIDTGVTWAMRETVHPFSAIYNTTDRAGWDGAVLILYFDRDQNMAGDDSWISVGEVSLTADYVVAPNEASTTVTVTTSATGDADLTTAVLGFTADGTIVGLQRYPNASDPTPMHEYLADHDSDLSTYLGADADGDYGYFYLDPVPQDAVSIYEARLFLDHGQDPDPETFTEQVEAGIRAPGPVDLTYVLIRESGSWPVGLREYNLLMQEAGKDPANWTDAQLLIHQIASSGVVTRFRKAWVEIDYYAPPTGPSGSAATTVTVSTSASGSKPLVVQNGSASTTVSVTGTASGSRPSAGTATTSVAVSSTASGSTVRSGSAATSVAVSTSASGTTPLVQMNGSAATAVTVSAQAAGTSPRRGSAATSVTVSAQAAGSTTRSGTAATSVAVSTAAAGHAARSGAASTSVGVTTSAAGTTPLVIQSGSAATTVSVTATASGSTSRSGAAETLVSLATTAAGHTDRNGAATTTATVSATATGHTTRTGTASTTVTPVTLAAGSAHRRGTATTTTTVATVATGSVVRHGTAQVTVTTTTTARGSSAAARDIRLISLGAPQSAWYTTVPGKDLVTATSPGNDWSDTGPGSKWTTTDPDRDELVAAAPALGNRSTTAPGPKTTTTEPKL